MFHSLINTHPQQRVLLVNSIVFPFLRSCELADQFVYDDARANRCHTALPHLFKFLRIVIPGCSTNLRLRSPASESSQLKKYSGLSIFVSMEFNYILNSNKTQTLYGIPLQKIWIPDTNKQKNITVENYMSLQSQAYSLINGCSIRNKLLYKPKRLFEQTKQTPIQQSRTRRYLPP